MAVTTPEKAAAAKPVKKKTPKVKTPTKLKTPARTELGIDDPRKVRFSPKVLLFEGKMSLTESTSGLPSSESPSSSKKSNLKKLKREKNDKDPTKKALDFAVDKKVVKLKEKIKKKRDILKSLPNRKGLGQVDPKTKTFVLNNSSVKVKKPKKAKEESGVKVKKGKKALKVGSGVKAERKAEAAGSPKKIASAENAVVKVKKKKVAKVDGQVEKRKRVASGPALNGTSPEKIGKRLKAAAKFKKNNTLTENKQKLFSMKKKERKVFRQQQKTDNWDQMMEIKMLWESLRRGTLVGDKRQELCDQLFQKTKGKIQALAFMHDCCRVLQCLLKHSTEEQRNSIFEEIKTDLVSMSKNRYAKNFIKRLMDKCNKEQREVILASFNSHVPELAKHADACKVLEYGYNNFTNASQRKSMIEEFYGPSFAFHKSEDHQSLDGLFQAKPQAKDAILDYMKKKIMSHVEKESFTHVVVQKATLEYLKLAHSKPEDRQEVIEHMRDSLVDILHTHEGARIALHALWHGTAKDRKSILKSFKGHIVKIAMDEHGYQVLLGAIDVTDDTKLVSKTLIEELAASAESLEAVLESKHGKTILYYLLHHRDPRHVHPDLLSILKEGDGNAASKKDPEVRKRELAAASLPHLLRHLASHANKLLFTKSGAVAFYTILEAGFAEKETEVAFNAVIDLVSAPFSGDGESHPVAHPGGHLCLKKIIQQNSAFAPHLLSRVVDSDLQSWATINRGCYVLIALVEHKDENVSERVKASLRGQIEELKQRDFSGAKVLVSKL